ncbi:MULTISPECIES: hypothetical protein [unclassified Streptomyces]|uniref:hypothetical protein n=1 Tax=unclassified Streptomyces TaxID=2593676 RepID=UPI0022559105|nr:hypothetical protein [Streptomyces sp. NBC_01767]MCX4396870.1 hypothetical protein [Streptomyces sp. NBC_01767]
MAPKRTTAIKPATEPTPCEPCDGTGNVPVTVRVGRKRRPVGQQDGLCLACLGSGTAPES